MILKNHMIGRKYLSGFNLVAAKTSSDAEKEVNMWIPKEIIVHETVRNDPVTTHFLSQCPGSLVKYTTNGTSTNIVGISETLKRAGNTMLEKILAGKNVVYIAPATNVVDTFSMPDDRMVCPHFERLKLASNGCFYQCDWCYLKLTYRAAFPFIAIRAQYDSIKEKLYKKLSKTESQIIFNSGELADSLSMEHLTMAGREFIPWFGNIENGYLFMLTKSDNVDGILDLAHNGHTIIAWSLNNKEVSRKFEIGAPPFERRLKAAAKVQDAGYPLRIRLDPIVPFNGWQEAYADTIEQIFMATSPERITLGTLRFEEGFYNMRNSIFTSGNDLSGFMEDMEPMFSPKKFPGLKKPKSGKYSFSEAKRAEIFGFVISEIRKHSNCRIALCKESASVWKKVELPLSQCSCVCQLDSADMA
jgi:spore photoproduct lyase